MTQSRVTLKQAESQTIELSLEQLIACQYWAKETIPLPNKKTKAHLVGGHLSPFKGRGMEFSEVRQYQPGDDIRTIDWKVTARTGKPHTKIFQEERERPIFLVIDLQDSMFFGSRKRFKSSLACLQASRAFWAAYNSGNRIAGLFSTAREHIELKPSNRRQDGLRLLQRMMELHNHRLHELYQEQNSYNINPDSLSDTLKKLRYLVKGGSLIYIFSDFFNLNSECEKQLSLLAQHNDIYGVMLTDPIEKNIPVAGQFIVTDGINTAAVDSERHKAMQRYQSNFATRFQHIEKAFIQAQCQFTECSTDQKIMDFSINPSKSNKHKNLTGSLR